MKRQNTFWRGIPLLQFGFNLALFSLICVPVYACTIFVLTDGKKVLFFNNEDWSNSKTRIWFVPAGDGYYGCAYLGFDDGWAQGGLNTKGLAFDWVAGGNQDWSQDDLGMRSVRGNASERMLETCATVDEAIAFYRQYREPSFCCSTILVADQTGASAIIGAQDGKLHIEKSHGSRGFGYGGQTLAKMLAETPQSEVENGVQILDACSQKGEYATKYSNVFDLKSGDIFLLQDRARKVKLNLALELQKKAHYYDLPQISQQLTQPPLPLLNNMKRFLLDEYKPIPDRAPEITAHLRVLVQDALAGTMRPGDYTAELWKELAPQQKEIQFSLKELGDFVSMILVESSDKDGRRERRYRIEFKKATVLQSYVMDAQNKVSLIKSEGIERTSGIAKGK